MTRLWSWLAALVLLAGCAQTQVNLPALEGASSARLPGKVIWHDLISATPQASQRFYGELFGWQFEQLTFNTSIFSSASYYVISHQGRVIGGMVDQADLNAEGNASQWVVVLASDNIDQSAAAVEANGGTLLGPVFDLQERGRMAVAKDGQGALFALLQTPNGDPADRSQIPTGDFLWNELWTSNVSQAGHFYRTLAPYQLDAHNLGDGHDYTLLKAQQKPRAGIVKMPVQGIPPTWVSYVRVADAAELDAILAQVESLGGKILLPAEDRIAGGRAALIAGPSGAGIALQTWPVTDKE
ncbi:VOC family protein [Gilvimarinus sp. DA14]|uniref:VOC family protein n=1 Tax=Gilvimarinus sp. DA14 TaxID=2956798 RepID=UPI0020B734E2|nr:VOC family protein [Gilvimarinus sp. DA14]UTF59164.1 VOC family protein [Gilvimarinus sp. DA14]